MQSKTNNLDSIELKIKITQPKFSNQEPTEQLEIREPTPTLVTACKNAAFPTFCLRLDMTISIFFFSFSMCRFFSSNFNRILVSCDAITVPPFSSKIFVTLDTVILETFKLMQKFIYQPVEFFSTCWFCCVLCCCHVVMFGRVAKLVFFSTSPLPLLWSCFFSTGFGSSFSWSMYVRLIPLSELLLRFAKLDIFVVLVSVLSFSVECKIFLRDTWRLRFELEFSPLSRDGGRGGSSSAWPLSARIRWTPLL